MDLSNVYFVIGTSYAGKSTVVKNLAKKHHGIALEENYHDAKLPELDAREFPNLCYTRDLQDWHEFIRRTPDEYITWLKNVKKECEIIELQMIGELLAKPEAQLISDIGFLSDFTLNMADAVKCPVSREIPEDVRTKLDEYLLRKRKKDS